MAFIPPGVQWYLADIVLEHRIDGDSRNLVYINTHLVEAGSPQEAYDKAQSLGRSADEQYENTDGHTVTVLFRGLRALSVIHEPLEDGAEIMYNEEIGVSEEKLVEYCPPRERLGVFLSIEPKTGVPNSMPAMFGSLLANLEIDDADKSLD